METVRQELRPYQVTAIDAVRALVRKGIKRQILVAPTGSGKTTIAAELIHLSALKNSRISFLAHRAELIDQCSKRLDEWSVIHGVLQSGHGRWDPHKRVQVASVMTMRNRLKAKHPDGTRKLEATSNIIIIDEAHHSTAATYEEIVDMHPDAIVIGLTATPCRLNGKPLGMFYEGMTIVAQPGELVEQGFLMEPEIYAPASIDLSGVRTRMGDYVAADVNEIVDKPKLVGDLVESWRTHLSKGTRSVVFCTTVAHATHVAEAFKDAGIRAAMVEGNTEKGLRRRILEDLRDGKLDVVTNVNLLTEGWDLPHLDCVMLARPTKSLTLLLQMVGRVMRVCEGKDRALILDHADNIRMHGFPTESREWTLDAGAPKREPELPGVKNCPRCAYVVETGTKRCPRCAYIWETLTKEEIEIADGKLELLKKDQYRIEIRYLWSVFAQAKRQRMPSAQSATGFPGWASRCFMEEFGRWPELGMKLKVKKAWKERHG